MCPIKSSTFLFWVKAITLKKVGGKPDFLNPLPINWNSSASLPINCIYLEVPPPQMTIFFYVHTPPPQTTFCFVSPPIPILDNIHNHYFGSHNPNSIIFPPPPIELLFTLNIIFWGVDYMKSILIV